MVYRPPKLVPGQFSPDLNKAYKPAPKPRARARPNPGLPTPIVKKPVGPVVPGITNFPIKKQPGLQPINPPDYIFTQVQNKVAKRIR